MTDPITLPALATVAGASAGSAIVVQFVRIFLVSLTAQGARMLSAATGLILVEGAILLMGPITPETLIVGALTGMMAGLAASKGYEIKVDGLNHSTTRR